MRWGLCEEGVAQVWGMEISIFSLIAVYLIGQGMVAVLILFLASRGTGLVIQLFSELDQNLAGAIQKVLSEGGGGFEPINPIQQAVAQMLISKMNAEIPQRDPNGQFLPNVE